jgi:hypothetical protein
MLSIEPSDYFPREVHPLLAAYCRHVAAGRRIADMIRKLENALAEEVNGGLTAVEVVSSRAKIMDRLLGMQDREVRAASSLATRLRLTPPEPPCALNVMVPPCRLNSPSQDVPWRPNFKLRRYLAAGSVGLEEVSL